MSKPSMLGYIQDQERALLQTFNEQSIFTEPMGMIFATKNIQKIYLLGSGTSYNATLAAKQWFEKYMNIEAIADIPTHFTNYHNPEVNKKYKSDQILVIGVTQSGTSISTIDAVKKAVSLGYSTVAITEATDSLVTKEAETVVKLTCGKEEIPVETRGYSITLLEFYLIALNGSFITGILNKEEYQNKLNQVLDTLKSYKNALPTVDKWYERHSEEFLNMKNAVITSYGINSCTGIEGVLKIGETWKYPIISYDMEESIHGPQSAFNTDTYIFMCASKEAEYNRVPKFINWFRENKVTEHLFVITDGDMDLDNRGLRFADVVEEDLSPLFFTLPFQIIAARNCINSGIDTAIRVPHRKAFAHVYPEEAK